MKITASLSRGARRSLPLRLPHAASPRALVTGQAERPRGYVDWPTVSCQHRTAFSISMYSQLNIATVPVL